MVIAYHIIFTMYGFWLPNDPRGSWSEFVRSWELYRAAGKATKVDARRSVAGLEYDSAARRKAKENLKYPPVLLDGVQARAVARGFARAVQQGGYQILACAIMPDHVHIVLRRDSRTAEAVVPHRKRAASRQLREGSVHPMAAHTTDEDKLPSPWARKQWTVFLNTDDDIRRAVDYVNCNPEREGLKPQHWNFVTSLTDQRGGEDAAR